MSDERLIRALRALDRPVDVDPAFGAALYAVLEGEYARRRGFRTGLAWLLVAALLAALIVGGALAAGSGLLWPPPVWQPSFGGLDGCPAELPDGQLMELSTAAEGYADPSDEWGPTADTTLRLYDDGLLLSGREIGRTVAEMRAGTSGITMRRLTPDGIRRVREAIGQSGVMTGCRDRYEGRPERRIVVRSEGGSAIGIALGGGGIRIWTPEELSAADELEQQLLHLEDWLPSQAWVDAASRPYAERWQVNIRLTGTVGIYLLDSPSPLPEADAIALPGGFSLVTFGDPYEEPDGGGRPGQTGFQGRCSVVGAEEALRITGVLAAAGAWPRNQHWWLRYPSGPAGVSIHPLLPTEEGCTPRMLGLTEPPGPTPTPVPAPSGDLAAVDPCRILSASSVAAALGLPNLRVRMEEQRLESGFAVLPDPDYRGCIYRFTQSQGDAWDDPAVLVYLRTSSVAPSEARALAHEVLGGTATEEVIQDMTIWRNACPELQSPTIQDLVEDSCRRAFVVSIQPLFIVITFSDGPLLYSPTGPVPVDWPALGRALARSIEPPT